MVSYSCGQFVVLLQIVIFTCEKLSLSSVKDKRESLCCLFPGSFFFVHFTLYVQLSLFFRSLAGVDIYYLGTRLTLDIAAPVEFTIAVIFDNLPFRVVSSSTTHDTAWVRPSRCFVAGSPNSGELSTLVRTVVRRSFDKDQVISSWYLPGIRGWLPLTSRLDLKFTSSIDSHLRCLIILFLEKIANLKGKIG